jgi:antitoxin component YwqK of YwqJK toxin-antitoxin module
MKYTFLLLISLISIATFAQNDFNKQDEKGNKHGLWKGVYEGSKRPRYEGVFEHGKETGVFTYYDDTSVKSIVATREFNKNDNSAYTIFYDQKKNKVSEGKVINKLHEGQWKYYHEASKIVMTLENYKNGKLEGLRSVYFPNGKIAEEIGYKNGIKEGVYKKYTEKGVVLEDSFYKKGQFDGTATFKDPDGNVVAKGLFLNGKKVGVWEFFENGKKVSEDNFNKPRKKFQKVTVLRKEEY